MVVLAVHEKLPACADGESVEQACARLARNVGAVSGGTALRRVRVRKLQVLDGWELWEVYRERERPKKQIQVLFRAFVRYC